MKTISKKIGFEISPIKKLCLYSRAGVGSHLGMILEEGKQNSVIIGITHSKFLPIDLKTHPCNFSALTTYDKGEKLDQLIRKKESNAILTIIDNKTMNYKNHKILHNLIHRTGLINKYEQENLKKQILTKNKISHLANEYNSEKTHILYQTKTKTEAIDINDKKRIIELVGLEIYDKNFKPLIELPMELGSQKLPIANILNEKSEKSGIEAICKILDNIS